VSTWLEYVTDHAREVIVAATGRARANGQPEIGAVDLALGLVAHNQGNIGQFASGSGSTASGPATS
jgi:hypothetical protein